MILLYSALMLLIGVVDAFRAIHIQSITQASIIPASMVLHSTSLQIETEESLPILPPSQGEGMRIVMKFGGSSLRDAQRLTYVARLISKHYELGYRPIIVCSAMGKTTNSLIAAGDFALDGSVHIDALRTLHMNTLNELGLGDGNIKEEICALLNDLEKLLEGVKYIGELTPRTKDALVSFGERMSVRIVSALLNHIGVPSLSFDAWKIGLQTTSEFGNAEVDPDSYARIKDTMGKLDTAVVPIVTGFLAHDKNGKITTLGRGGSDLTATVLGSGVNVDEVQVWKDVDGIMSADPRLVTNAIPVNAITYEEAAELAYFGAEVLHPISMQPAIRSKIPVRVKNSYNPSAVGTLITEKRDMSNSIVTAITSKNNIDTIDIISTRMLGAYGFLSMVFRAFSENKISVDVVASSDVSVSLTIDNKSSDMGNVDKLVKQLSQFAQVKVYKERCIISLICNLEKSNQVMSTVFDIMEKLDVQCEMLSQGASKVNISLVVEMKHKDVLIKALHEVFFGNAKIFTNSK